MALQAANSCFVAIDPEDDAVVALRKAVGESEECAIRTCAARDTNPVDEAPVEEQGSLAEVELNYVLVSTIFNALHNILLEISSSLNQLSPNYFFQ